MKNIKDQSLFIPYELCLKMHKLGFDQNGFDCYWGPVKGTGGFSLKHDKIVKILYDQAFAWFRKKRYIASIYYSPKNIVNINSGFRYNIIFDNGNIIEGEGYYPNYEYIRLECLKTLIDLYENNLKNNYGDK